MRIFCETKNSLKESLFDVNQICTTNMRETKSGQIEDLPMEYPLNCGEPKASVEIKPKLIFLISRKLACAQLF